MGRDLECCRKKVVGKPYEGEPHVRIEVAGDGNQDRDGLLRHSQRKRGATDRPGLRPRRHSLTLPLRRLRSLALRAMAIRHSDIAGPLYESEK